MLGAAGTSEQMEAYWACGIVRFRKVLPNGYIVALEVKAPGQSKASAAKPRKVTR